ncbi:uncharacterized protein VTP21DRAFT_10157 [Calcarisporiella thermophila]|uniref:uncharacterized protein n=1 Tax=Calcarisporiella thermophila TaxID=911321 RepID=UPI0037421E50
MPRIEYCHDAGNDENHFDEVEEEEVEEEEEEETRESRSRYAPKISKENLSKLERLAERIVYSPRYSDDVSEYRHVTLPKEMLRYIPRHFFDQENPRVLRLLTEEEWRSIGVVQSVGWEHYLVHTPEPHILGFKREKDYQLKYGNGYPPGKGLGKEERGPLLQRQVTGVPYRKDAPTMAPAEPMDENRHPRNLEQEEEEEEEEEEVLDEEEEEEEHYEDAGEAEEEEEEEEEEDELEDEGATAENEEDTQRNKRIRVK